MFSKDLQTNSVFMHAFIPQTLPFILSLFANFCAHKCELLCAQMCAHKCALSVRTNVYLPCAQMRTFRAHKCALSVRTNAYFRPVPFPNSARPSTVISP